MARDGERVNEDAFRLVERNLVIGKIGSRLFGVQLKQLGVH